MTEFWRKSTLPAHGTISEAFAIIETGGTQFCMVIDADGKLLGTITDGDIRRGLLKGLTLDEPVAKVMNTTPKIVSPEDSRAHIQGIIVNFLVRQLPVVADDGRVVGLITANEFLHPHGVARDNAVVLLAGGMGNRLRPLTENTPKPLLKVGSKPLLETILETLISFNFRKFFISVNFKAEMVKAHFGNGSEWGCSIDYLEETTKLGTAGPLSLIPERQNSPLIVMNGDLLTKVNFSSLLEFHRQSGSDATMCVREYDFNVPYGVVDINGTSISSIEEKPVYNFFVNAGIYVIEAPVLEIIPKNKYFDMTDLFKILIESKYKTNAFPIQEYWMDIGKIDDFEKANGDFSRIFIK